MLSEWVSVSGDASSSGLSACRTHDDALQCLAHCDKAPERDEQLARQGGPREGGIIVLRVPARLLSAVRAWYHRARALPI